MDDQLLLTIIFEGTEIGQTCACFSNFDVTGSGKLGTNILVVPGFQTLGDRSPWRLRLL